MAPSTVLPVEIQLLIKVYAIIMIIAKFFEVIYKPTWPNLHRVLNNDEDLCPFHNNRSLPE